MSTWIKYQIDQSSAGDGSLLVEKRLEKNNANITIAEAEAYNGYTIVGDSSEVDRTEGLLYQNKDNSTKALDKRFKYTMSFNTYAEGGQFSYSDDCAGFEPMSIDSSGKLSYGGWTQSPLLDMFNPCVLKPGRTVPEYYLKKNNLSKKLDGTSVTLSNADGDVMVEVDGLLYGKIVHGTGYASSIVTMTIANYKFPGCFCFNDFGGVIKDKFYVGRYMGVIDSNVLRSKSGVAPTTSKTITVLRTAAKARGKGYSLNSFYVILLWQMMFMFLFKSQNAQAVLGKGKSSSGLKNTGGTDAKGWIYGLTGDNTAQVTFLGLEDWYGNAKEFVDGCYHAYNIFKLTRDPNLFGEEPTNYEIIDDHRSLSDGILKNVIGTNDFGFLPLVLDASGTADSWFGDKALFAGDMNVCAYGGAHSLADTVVGPFCWDFSNESVTSDPKIGARLCKF